MVIDLTDLTTDAEMEITRVACTRARQSRRSSGSDDDDGGNDVDDASLVDGDLLRDFGDENEDGLSPRADENEAAARGSSNGIARCSSDGAVRRSSFRRWRPGPRGNHGRRGEDDRRLRGTVAQGSYAIRVGALECATKRGPPVRGLARALPPLRRHVVGSTRRHPSRRAAEVPHCHHRTVCDRRPRRATHTLAACTSYRRARAVKRRVRRHPASR